jgi:tol-pal system protein YbgF
MRRIVLAGGDLKPGRIAALALATMLAAGLGGGCAMPGGNSKGAGETKASPPADSPAALRQEIDRLRTDIAELRTRLEAVQRAGTEHADRTAQETRAEFDAVRKAMEASSRHDLQRQVEVLDAQARRVDLLERRVTELGQTLRRVELGIGGIESQLSRMLEANPPSGGGARGGSAARSSEPRATEAAPAGDGAAAAGAGLTPPAMLGQGRASRPAPATSPARPAPEAKAAPAEPPRSDDASAASKGADASGATPPRPGADPARVAKAAPPTAEPKPPSPAPARAPKPATATPAAGSVSARALFDRAMDNWNKGEHGQAVLEFDELVQTFPSDPLAASAQFRIGEAYYAARDFERASLEYKKAVDLAPKGKDTPQALLRLGLAYRAQKKESDARQAWNQLVRDFPESDASEEARRALRGR